MMNGMGWSGMWFGNFFWLIALGLLIWAILSYANKNRDQRDDTPQQQDALEILKKRYARGDIRTDEFEHMKRELLN